MKRRPKHPTTEKFVREGRDLLLSEQEAVIHGLFCTECELEWQATLALSLVGWTPSDFLEEVERRYDQPGEA